MEEDQGNPRGREFVAHSEEELLAMQEEFLAHQRRPAANVTRVSRRNGSGALLSSSIAAPGGSAAATYNAPNTQARSIDYTQSRGTALPRAQGPALGLGGSSLSGVGGGGGLEGSVRGDEDLHASTEEELLRVQEEFLAQNSRPAARVTRITRRAPAAQHGVVSDAVAAAAASGAAAPAAVGVSQAVASRIVKAGAAGAAFPPETRATGPLVASAASGVAAGVSHQGEHESRAQELKSMLAPIEGLLGDIVERPSPALPPEPPGVGPVVGRDVVAPLPGGAADALPGTATGAGAGLGPGAPPASFPEALHRRQSKFALNRKAKQQQQSELQHVGAASEGRSRASAPPGAPPATTAAGAAVATNAARAVTCGTLTDWSVLPTGPVSAAATTAAQDACKGVPNVGAGAPGGGDGPCYGGGELGAAMELNLEAVSRMRPEEVAEALKELSLRMSPEALDFLKRRGAQRLTTQRPQRQPQDDAPALAVEVTAAAGRGGAGRLTAGLPQRPQPGLASEMASCVTLEDSNAIIDSALRALTNAGSGRDREATAALPASVAAPGNPLGSVPIGALAAAQQRQLAQPSGSGGEGVHTSAAAALGGTQAEGDGGAQGQGLTRGSPADPRLVARLRFDVDGSVVDVQAPDEVFVEEEVLLRDQLRRDEGSAPPGYTLGELLILCRSAVAAQRVAGLAAIADLAATARPRPEDLQMYAPAASAVTQAAGSEAAWAPGQMMRRFVPIPEQLRSRAPACSVSWQEVWQFFVSELGLVGHLRLALDDDRPGVQAAAATALAAVLSRSESELLAAEMADVCPATGWPSAAGGYLTRQGGTAPWETAPPAPPAAAGPPGTHNEPDAPEDVALVDPLAGALQMGLLQRVRYLLASRQSPGALLPLLAVLCAAARGGGEVALAVAREPLLLAAVGSLLDPAAAAAIAAEGTSSSDLAVQVAALTVVRLLCGASSVAAQLVRSAGLLAHTHAFVLLAGPAAGGGGSGGGGDGGTKRDCGGGGSLALQLLRLEALRIWRVCAHHGIALATLDDLYGSLCHLLLPPLGGQAAAAADADAVQQLTTTELYLLLATLVRHSFAVAGGDVTIGRSMLGPGAAAVIAAEAAAWLRPAALAGVAAAAVTRCKLAVPLLAAASTSGSGPSGGLLRVLLGAHAAVLLPPAAAHVACLAAVAGFLATYWATFGTSQQVFADVRGALAASGLLPPPRRTAGGADTAAGPVAMSATDELAIALLQARRPTDEGEGEGEGGGGAGPGPLPSSLPLTPPSDRPQGDNGQRQEQPRRGAVEAGGGGGLGSVVGGAPGRQESPVGGALAEWALAAVGGMCVAAPAAEGTADGLRLGALAQACLQVAAAALLYGILQLAAAVHRDATAPPAAAGPLAADVIAAAAPLCCQAGAAAPVAVGRVLCPWHAAALQRQLHLTRLLLLAATLLPPRLYQYNGNGDGNSGDDGDGADGDSTGGGAQISEGVVGPTEEPVPTGKRRSGAAGGGQQEARRRVQLYVLEGCLAALAASPPGAEGLCLQMLRMALRGGLLAQPLQAAYAAAAKLAAAAAAAESTGTDVKLAAAAAGVPYTAPIAGDAPFPLPAAPPPAADVADVLFESYAASWLSLISQRRLAAASASRAGAPTAGGTAAATAEVFRESGALPPLPRIDSLELTPVSLQGQRGSRLPAPGQWSLLEAHRLPHQLQHPRNRNRKQQSGGGGRGGEREQGAGEDQEADAVPAALHPVGCALMLCLGREASGGDGALRWLSEGTKMQAALQAAYLFRAEEMVPRDADEAFEGSWRDPWVRWSLAGLSRRYLASRDGSQARPPGPPGPEWLPPALAEQLIAALSSACFGDPLLAALLALALAADASPVVRLQVWNGLAIEKSLHLLPPLSRCLGSAVQYLGPSPPAHAAGAATASVPALSPSSATQADCADSTREVGPDPAFLAAVQRSLIEADLDRALLPLHTAAPDGVATRAGGSVPDAALGAVAGCASVAGDVALQLLASNLLRRERWSALERAWQRSGSLSASQLQNSGLAQVNESGSRTGRPGSSPGAAMLAALVRGARPELAAAVVVAAERRCGVRREEAAAVLAQTCSGGDVALRERVRHVLSLCGLL